LSTIYNLRYSDWKQVCLRDHLLDELSKDDKDLVLFQEVTPPTRIQNAFFGATPQHPLIGEQLKQILNHVQMSHYEGGVYMTTGPDLLYHSFQIAKKKNLVSEEKHFAGRFVFRRKAVFTVNGKKVIRHKCENCGYDQNWGAGNNYNVLFNERRYYCEDAASLFRAFE